MSCLPRPPGVASLPTPLISEPSFEDEPHSLEGKKAASQLRPKNAILWAIVRNLSCRNG